MPKRSRGAAPRAADSEPSPKARRSEGTSAMRLETALSKADDASEAFFELANAASIAVAVPGDLDIDVTILQDPANTTTGGCVWETAYVLAEWAYWRLPAFEAVDLRGRLRRPRCLELGAGCGLTGIALARSGAAAEVLLTEVAGAMDNLRRNVEANPVADDRYPCRAAALDWTNDAEVAAVAARGPWDVILGTDVIFRLDLVEPLLRTLWRCAHDETAVYLCLQIRCPDSHASFLEKAPRFFRKVELTAFADMKPVAAADMPSICAVDIRGTSAAESVAAELDVFLLQLEEPIPDESADSDT